MSQGGRRWPEWTNQRQPSRSHSQPADINPQSHLNDDRPQSLLPYLTFNHPPPARYTQTEPPIMEERGIGTSPLPPLDIPQRENRDQSTQQNPVYKDNYTMTSLAAQVSRSTMVTPRPISKQKAEVERGTGLTISPIIMPIQYMYEGSPYERTNRVPEQVRPRMDIQLGPVLMTDIRKQTALQWEFMTHMQNDELIYLRNSHHGDIKRFDKNSSESHLLQLHKLNSVRVQEVSPVHIDKHLNPSRSRGDGWRYSY